MAVGVDNGVRMVREYRLHEVCDVKYKGGKKRIDQSKSGRHKEGGIVSNENGVVAIEFHLSLHVWECVTDSQGRRRTRVACGKVVRIKVCVTLEIITGRRAGVPS